MGAVEQTPVHFREVERPVIVVRFQGVVLWHVLVDRRHPKGRHAQFDEIVELLDNPIERSSVHARVRGIGRSLVPAEKPIRHHEVDDVILGNLPSVHIPS